MNPYFNFIYNKTLINFGIYGVGQAVNLLSPLFVTPYLIYVCGIEKFGVIAVGQSVAYVLIVIVDYSSYIIGVKDVSLNRNDHDSLQAIFVNTFFSKFFLLFVALSVAAVMLLFVPFFKHEAKTILLSLSILVAQTINPTWFLQGIENFEAITVINIKAKIIYVAGIFTFINSSSDYIYANLWLGGGALFAYAAGFFYMVYKERFNMLSYTLPAIQNLIVKDFSFCVSQFFFAVRNYSPILVISFFAGDYIAGQFRIIEQIINLFRTYLQMFFKFSYSYVCFEIDKSTAVGFGLWKKFNGLNLIFLILLLMITCLFSGFILTFFRVGPELVSEMENYLHLAIFIPFLIGITLPLEQLIFSLNKNKEYISLTVFSALLCVAGTAVAILAGGLTAVFVMLAVIEIVLISSYIVILKKKF